MDSGKLDLLSDVVAFLIQHLSGMPFSSRVKCCEGKSDALSVCSVLKQNFGRLKSFAFNRLSMPCTVTTT